MSNITVKKVNFDLEKNFPDHWLNGNPLLTHLVNSFHLIFPDGERFFIRSVKANESFIQNEELKKRVKSFIAQEVLHGAEHKKFWNTLMDKGYDIDTFLDISQKFNYDLAEPTVNRFIGVDFSLSVTVALEHMTAILAKFVFEDLKELKDLDMPIEMKNMLLWHAAEEIEHKSVAFDVLKEANDSYALRAFGFLYAFATLSFFTLLGFFIFLYQDWKKGGEIRFSHLVESFGYFGKLLRFMAKEIPIYFRPDFHPDDLPNDHFAVDFFKRVDVEKKKSVA